jgi:hypothetical protein
MKPELRRSMSEALRTVDLPAEAIVFIKEGGAKPRGGSGLLERAARSVPSAPAEPSPAPAMRDRPASVSLDANGLDLGRAQEGGDSPAAMARPSRESGPAPAVGIAAMTVRVPAEIPGRLLRASTDRKLSRRRPCTQQEIVAEALTQWLGHNGY